MRGRARIVRVAPAVADEQPGQGTDDLPGDEQGQEVSRRDEHEHGRDERQHGGEQARPAVGLRGGRVGHDRRGHQRDKDDHGPGKAVDGQPQLDARAPLVDGLRLARCRPHAEQDGRHERPDRDRREEALVTAGRDDDHGRQRGQEGQDRHAHPFSRRSFSVMSARRTR